MTGSLPLFIFELLCGNSLLLFFFLNLYAELKAQTCSEKTYQ